MSDFPKPKDGAEVLESITEQIRTLKEKGIMPKLLFLGSYAYYLLKDHYIRTGLKTDNPYIEIQEVEIEGFILDVAMNQKTLFGGLHTKQSVIIKVYGD